MTKELDLTALRQAVHGAIIAPDEDGYAEAVSGFNVAEMLRPDVVVVAASVGDVAATVRFATDASLPVRVQATGHGMGRVTNGGVLINTSRLQQVVIDPERRRATVAAGVRWRDVIAAAAPYGLAPLSGSSVDVGVIGYTVGGGVSLLGRQFGFAADHVHRLRLVLASGEEIEVDADHEPDLFWALRGGKCDIGVVTEIEFDLFPVATYYGGGIFFAGDDAPSVLHAFAEWVDTLPDHASSSVALTRLPDVDPVPAPLRGTLSVHLRYIHVGDLAEGAALLAPMRAVATPLMDLVEVSPYAAIASVHMDPEGPMPERDDSALLRAFPTEAVNAVLAAAGPGTDVPLIIVEIRRLGGAMGREPAVANAVGGRDAAFSVVVVGPYPPPLRKAVDAAVSSVLSAVQPWSTGRTQINFQGFATANDAIRRAWPDSIWERLATVKETWDPDGRFRFAYSVD